MDDNITTPQQQRTAPAAEAGSASSDGHAASGFPTEPFPCPYCGQMLAPNVRVCVACRKSIDPRDIAAAAAPPPPAATAPPRQVQPRVQFSVPIFLMVLASSLGIAALALETLGPVKSQYIMPGLVLFSSIWVYFDAYHRKIPKPLHWGIGSLLVWIVVFPWYLARRRQPAGTCPLIEMEGRRFFRIILILVLAGLLFSVLLQFIRGPLK
jgi:hypothetical protein